VQRAPSAGEQPQPRPIEAAPPDSRSVGTSWFSAAVDLDLMAPVLRLGAARVCSGLVVRLVEACLAEGLMEDAAPLRLGRPSGAGLLGLELGLAVRQSAHTIASAWDVLAVPLPAPVDGALTVLDLSAIRARTAGGWGLGGAVVVTLGPALPTVVSRTGPDGPSFRHRELTTLALAVPDGRRQALAAVRVLESVVVPPG
jgi:hypothetical protein